MNLRNILFLILIVAIAFFLRFYKVTEVPPSLNWDEVSIAYNAYSVMKTGKDEWKVLLENLPRDRDIVVINESPSMMDDCVEGLKIARNLGWII